MTITCIWRKLYLFIIFFGKFTNAALSKNKIFTNWQKRNDIKSFLP